MQLLLCFILFSIVIVNGSNVSGSTPNATTGVNGTTAQTTSNVSGSTPNATTAASPPSTTAKKQVLVEIVYIIHGASYDSFTAEQKSGMIKNNSALLDKTISAAGLAVTSDGIEITLLQGPVANSTYANITISVADESEKTKLLNAFKTVRNLVDQGLEQNLKQVVPSATVELVGGFDATADATNVRPADGDGVQTNDTTAEKNETNNITTEASMGHFKRLSRTAMVATVLIGHVVW